MCVCNLHGCLCVLIREGTCYGMHAAIIHHVYFCAHGVTYMYTHTFMCLDEALRRLEATSDHTDMTHDDYDHMVI